MELFNRKSEILTSNLAFYSDDFEIDFRVEFNDDSEAKVSEVMIYNLSSNTINKFKKGSYFILNCGYGLNVGNILSGTIKRITTYWEGLDKVTKFYVVDGDIDVSVKGKGKTYGKDTTSNYIIEDLANMLGIKIAEFKTSKNIVYKKGRSFSDISLSTLKEIVKETGSKVHIKNEKLYVSESNAGYNTGFLLNHNTGLIGSPTESIEDDVVKYHVNALLNHEITTGSIIEIESKTINGYYKVKKGIHFGDFTTEFEVVGV